MSGIYGTIKPSRINIDRDVDIFYNYKPNRSSSYDSDFMRLRSEYFTNSKSGDSEIEGLYNLKLPLSIFGKKGIYTIYITPKEIKTTIEDISTLDMYPDVRGIVFSAKALPEEFIVPNSLVGYRVEYGNRSTDETRIITSSNTCALVPGTNKYKLTNYEKSLIFCTVTPSTAPSYAPNTVPTIGTRKESVSIYNTKFSPVMMEIEMVDKDIETLSYMLEGDQVRNLDTGIFTVYNDEGDIYTQFETYNLKSKLGKPLYDVKVNKGVIDTKENHKNIIETNE